MRMLFADIVTDDADSMTRIRALDTDSHGYAPRAVGEIRRPLQMRMKNLILGARRL